MATAKQILGAMNRAAEVAMERQPNDLDGRAGTFVAYLCGVLRALEEPTAVATLNRLLGIEARPPTDGA